MSKRMLEHYSHVRNKAKSAAVAVFDLLVHAENSPEQSPQNPHSKAEESATAHE
jgi:hypothetical protein